MYLSESKNTYSQEWSANSSLDFKASDPTESCTVRKNEI